jgi:hypothetical protein
MTVRRACFDFTTLPLDGCSPDLPCSQIVSGISGDFRARFSSPGRISLWEGSPHADVRTRIVAENPAIRLRLLAFHLISVPCNTSSGETLMAGSKNVLRHVITAFLGDSPSPQQRRSRRLTPTVDGLEDRVVLSHLGGLHHVHVHNHAASVQTSGTTSTTATASTTAASSATSTTATASTASTGTESTTGTTSSSSSTALSTARQTLRNDIQTIELASGTTIGELTAIRAAFQTLASDGLQPSSSSALSSFENSLVKSFATGTTLTGNAALLAQFEALYTSSPTTQQTTDLTTAYNALAAAVTSSNITSADLTTIDTDYAAVLAAEGSTSTSSFPYFSLVTGSTSGEGYSCH